MIETVVWYNPRVEKWIEGKNDFNVKGNLENMVAENKKLNYLTK